MFIDETILFTSDICVLTNSLFFNPPCKAGSSLLLKDIIEPNFQPHLNEIFKIRIIFKF